jgi:UDP-N-acetylglucosamine--N-acetylmuramyl-(pentapeptide) pyrophosphoryl-undecaprenol N-acetylglucosamine transferase
MKTLKRIIVSGGGTGGHIFPAIAIADEFRRNIPGIEILFVGAQGRMEMEKVPEAGYPIKGLNIAGFQRRLTFKNLLFPFKLIYSIFQALGIVRDFKPDLVIGTGGYASGPILRMANLLGIPTYIQEQNSFAGVTNKILSAKANKIFVAYDKMDRFFPSNKIEISGNPIRQDLSDITNKREEGILFYDLDPTKKTIFITGGSLGAKTLNESVVYAMPLIEKNRDVQILWQIGKVNFDFYSNTDVAKLNNVKPIAFVKRMDLAYAVADIVVCRAGALTISEICSSGKASILVPSPNVSEDHQTKNAEAMVEKKASILIKDSESKEILIKKALELLENENQLQSFEKNSKKNEKKYAANFIYEKIVLDLQFK